MWQAASEVTAIDPCLLVFMPPLECGQDRVTRVEWTEFGKSDGMSLLWLGYKTGRFLASTLFSFPLLRQAAILWDALWRLSWQRSWGSLSPPAMRKCKWATGQIPARWALRWLQPVTHPEPGTRLSHAWKPNHQKLWDNKDCVKFGG